MPWKSTWQCVKSGFDGDSFDPSHPSVKRPSRRVVPSRCDMLAATGQRRLGDARLAGQLHKGCLGSPVVPFYPFLGEGSPTKVDYRKKGTLIVTSLLAELGVHMCVRVRSWVTQ